MKTEAAKCAAEIRKALRAKGIKASVKSDNFSMGDSVRVKIANIIGPQMLGQLKSEFSKYEYGRFDGMQDLYEYTNVRDDIPQTKYLFIEYDYKATDAFLAKLVEFIRPRINLDNDFEYQRMASRVLNGSEDCITWDEVQHLASEVAA